MKILAGASVRQNSKVLAAHLETMEWQTTSEDVQVDLCYVNDLDPDDEDYKEASDVLFNSGARVLNTNIHERPSGAEYVVASDTHHWQEPTFYWLAQQKQKLLDLAVEEEYDAVFLVDTDLLLSPDTLQSLIHAEVPIVSAVFWTSWNTGIAPLPQVWLQHPYGFDGSRIKEPDFLRRLQRRELLPVRGLGACTLIQTEALQSVCYWPYLEGLPTGGMWQGEDRTFCVRANNAHIPLFGDAWPDIAHIYRPEDIESIPDWMEYLSLPQPTTVTYGNYVNFTVEPLEEPALHGKKLHIRGRFGQLKILPEIEYDLMDLSVGQSCITRLHFPLYCWTRSSTVRTPDSAAWSLTSMEGSTVQRSLTCSGEPMAKIKYVSWIPFGFAGMAPCTCRIYIHKSMMDRTPEVRERLINHERVHVIQMYRTGYWVWLFRYLFNGRWRAIYELEAYASNIISIVGSGVVSIALANSYIDGVLDRYYPKWWPFNKGKPSRKQCQAILKSFIDAYYA